MNTFRISLCIAIAVAFVAVNAQDYFQCTENECGKRCEGEECAKECTGKDCGLYCKGEECAKACTARYCGWGCKGAECAKECTGEECGVECTGEYCACECTGPECGKQCTGSDCGPDNCCKGREKNAEGVCVTRPEPCAAGHYRAAAGAECTEVKGSDYCGPNTAYSGGVCKSTVKAVKQGPNTVFSGGVCVRSTPSVFGYPWACETTIPCFLEFFGQCWIKEYRPAYYSTTCSNGAGAGELSAGADDGDGRGGMVLTEDLTDTARAQISAGCTLFSESGGQVLPEWAAQVNGSVTLIQSICAELDANGPGDFQLSGAAAAAAAPTAADLETTIANQRVGLAVVSTLLAVAIVHALYSAIVAPRGPRSSAPTLASEEPARAGRQRNSSASAASFSAGKGRIRTGSEFSISEI